MTTDGDANAGLNALYAAWAEAFAQRDVSAVMSLLTDDYVLWASGAAPMLRPDIEPRLHAAFGAYTIVPSFECEERTIVGDMAFERGWDIQEVHGGPNNAMVINRQRVFLIARRGPDGAWRFARGMSQPGPAPSADP
jgi:ketosteroid isomerase-like protein